MTKQRKDAMASRRSGVPPITQFKSIEDVLDFAISREIEAHKFYLKLVEWVERPEVARAFEGMATDELQHRIRLEAVKSGEVCINREEVGNLGIADAMPPVEPKVDMTYIQALKVAMQREKNSYRIYMKLASIAIKPEFRDLFLKLAQEEAGHKLRIEIEYDWMTS